MPYATEMPDRFELGHQETPSPLNPLGIKGAGEAGVIPVSAVIASAVEDAVGFRIDAMPISPSILFGLRTEFAAGRVEPTAVGRAVAAHQSLKGTAAMKIAGSALVHADPARTWAAITDPAVLATVIPGCEVLDARSRRTGSRLTVTLGVASIKGSYSGEVSFADLRRAVVVDHARQRIRCAGHDRHHRRGSP